MAEESADTGHLLIQRVFLTTCIGLFLVLMSNTKGAEWQGGAGTWDDTDASHWDTTSPPGAGDQVDLIQSSTADFTILFDASGSINRDDADETNDQRFGGLTLNNSGDGATSLSLDESDDELAATTIDVGGGGLLNISAGLVNAEQHVTLDGGKINQSAGWFESEGKNRDLMVIDGTFDMTGGRGEFRTLKVGTGSGDGVVNVSGGAILRGGQLTGYVIGGGEGSGTLNVQTNGQISGIDQGGKGKFIIDSRGTVNLAGGKIGDTSDGQSKPKELQIRGGVLNVSSGELRTRYAHYIGTRAGKTGTMNITGGLAVAPQGMRLGHTEGGNAGGAGIVNQEGGQLNISGSPSKPGLVIGHPDATQESVFTFKTGTQGGKFTLETRQTGTFRGYGTFTGGKTKIWIDNSGRIEANGFGEERDLDLTAFRDTYHEGYGEIQNLTDNPTDGNNGYFATDGGRLILPSYTGANASNGAAFNWGEPQDDTSIDLINSARVEFTDFSGDHALIGQLLAPGRSDVTGSSLNLMSVHDLSLTNPDGAFTDYDLTIRYDHTGLEEGQESLLRLYHFTNGEWLDVTSNLDTTNKLITAEGLTEFSQFGIGAVPEPTTTVMFFAVLLGLLGIRRRR